MYEFDQPRHGLLWALVVLQALGMLEGTGNRVAEAHPTEAVKAGPEVFSPQWVKEYSADKLGCELGRGHYTWRSAGFGSNINNLLNAWVYTLVVEGWSDLALEVDSTQLPELECYEESGGLAYNGWSCLFTSMPHLCTFDSAEMWKRHLDLAGVSDEDQEEADKISLDAIRASNVSKSFNGLDIDQRGARAVMTNFLWSFMAPWLRKDISAVTHVRETFESSPFIGIHVRRGDKIRGANNIALKQDAETYLAAAVRYLEQEPGGTSVDAIKGLWVASDDNTVVDEVRTVVNAYFPSVRREDIVFVASGVPGGAQILKVVTRSDRQGYASTVYLLADIEQLAAADVFVGTCSSNIGRLVMLLRDGLGKDKQSAISLDSAWHPKRERNLALD